MEMNFRNLLQISLAFAEERFELLFGQLKIGMGQAGERQNKTEDRGFRSSVFQLPVTKFYQITQASFLTIRLPALQPHAFANSGMLESGPFTRYWAQECGSVSTCSLSPSGVAFAAQT